MRADAEVVLGVGRFVRKKGFEYLIDAVARLAPLRQGLRLVLAGGGDLREEFTARIADRGIETRVILPGVLHQDDVAASLAAADVAVVPSVRDPSGNVDGLPNVVMEALASGTPLVATPAGGIGSVVQDGRTGLLVPEADPVALSAAIARLLDGPAEAAALAAAARRWAQREGSWSHAIDGFERAYEIACRPANGRADIADSRDDHRRPPARGSMTAGGRCRAGSPRSGTRACGGRPVRAVPLEPAAAGRPMIASARVGRRCRLRARRADLPAANSRSPSARRSRPCRTCVLGGRHQRDAHAGCLAGVGGRRPVPVAVRPGCRPAGRGDRGRGGPSGLAIRGCGEGRLVVAGARVARGPLAVGVPAAGRVRRRRQGPRRVHERRRADRPAWQPCDPRRAGGEPSGRNAGTVLSAPSRDCRTTATGSWGSSCSIPIRAR